MLIVEAFSDPSSYDLLDLATKNAHLAARCGFHSDTNLVAHFRVSSEPFVRGRVSGTHDNLPTLGAGVGRALRD